MPNNPSPNGDHGIYLRRYQFVLVVTKSKKEKIDLHNLNWLHLGRQETTKSYNGWQE